MRPDQHGPHSTRTRMKLEFLLSQSQGDATEMIIVLFLNRPHLQEEAA
jgi:hypothetical protein